MSKRSGGVEVETNRTSQRGVYWRSLVGLHPRRGTALSGVGTSHGAVAVLRSRTPTHSPGSCRPSSRWPYICSRGHMVGGRGGKARSSASARSCSALGTITAGLTHQLNNPAAATARAVADLREGVGKMRYKLAMLADGKFTPRSAAGAGAHSGRSRRNGRQIQGPGIVRAGDLGPRGPGRRLVGRPWHCRRLGLRAHIRGSGPGRRLAGTCRGIRRLGRLLGNPAEAPSDG